DANSHEPSIDGTTLVTVTSDASLLKEYEQTGGGGEADSPPGVIEHQAVFKVISPVKRGLMSSETFYDEDGEGAIPDDFYYKRHRRHELEEKKQKNREKERLKHGYYQQNQLVERIKTMDKSSLQSIVSSIRHRTQIEDEEDERYLDILHERLLKDATELLNRYEALGLSKTSVNVEEEPTEINPDFHQAVQVEAIRQKARQLSTFNKHTKSTLSSRRSSRHVSAFGVKLPDFTYKDFELPHEFFLLYSAVKNE
ncbi:hypothetical protein BY458DRAFT_430217, partial [Sporodiniella umbellata]